MRADHSAWGNGRDRILEAAWRFLDLIGSDFHGKLWTPESKINITGFLDAAATCFSFDLAVFVKESFTSSERQSREASQYLVVLKEWCGRYRDS